ncbi:Mobile element protein [Cupriavidus basilensis]|uniref:Mobile element protein n=1 Tax=Cupriavidus basilensis TaxID=68895 RepID=A0A0C4YI60_9BURK|nr:Mobile element protein [Cupriavidus basilensis]
MGNSWRMDEIYILVKGRWTHLDRAVDKSGRTIDFLLRARRDTAAARHFLEKAIAQNGVPQTVTVDKNRANLAALQAINAERETLIKIRQNKYLNNLVKQDHRSIKRRVRPMLGFQTFRCARIILGGIETMRMIRKGQMATPKRSNPSAAEQFCSLVA